MSSVVLINLVTEHGVAACLCLEQRRPLRARLGGSLPGQRCRRGAQQPRALVGPGLEQQVQSGNHGGPLWLLRMETGGGKPDAEPSTGWWWGCAQVGCPVARGASGPTCICPRSPVHGTLGAGGGA